MTPFAAAQERDYRLRILQALYRETDHRLSDRMLEPALEVEGHRRSMEYLRTQLRKLAELGAVTLVSDAEALIIAEIARPGLDHVRRVGVLEGVKRPDPGE